MQSLIHKPFLILICLLAPAAALAVDGVVLINQNRAMFGGITPGDGPGFPVTLSEPGSYRLSGNLSANGTAIEIHANNVTLDLNGFSIIGNGTDAGVTTEGATVAPAAPAVRNGSIVNFFIGIDFSFSRQSVIKAVRAAGNDNVGILAGDGSTVAGNTARGNFDGISAGRGSTVTSNTARGNDAIGISAANGSTVSGNTASDNGGTGIGGGVPDGGATLTDNTALGNGGIGIRAFPGSTVSGNTASDNGVDGIAVDPGSTVAGNTAFDNSGNGLQIECPSNVIENTATGNGGPNLALIPGGSGCNLDNNVTLD